MSSARPVAFPAGFVSFLAPCVLPLVPGYLSAVSAVEAERLGEPGAARRVVVAACRSSPASRCFVLLGAGAAAVGLSIAREPVLLADRRLRPDRLRARVHGPAAVPKRLVAPGLVQGARRSGSSVLLGAAFAVCAAPCIGAVLGAILVLAGDAGTVLEGSRPARRLRARARRPVPRRGVAFGPRWASSAGSATTTCDPDRQRRGPRRARRAALLRPLLVAARLPEPLSAGSSASG